MNRQAIADMPGHFVNMDTNMIEATNDGINFMPLMHLVPGNFPPPRSADVPVEIDPTGRDAHEMGAKLDEGKPRMDLVLGGFARSLVEVAKVGTFGARKYADNSWIHVPDGIARYSDAGLRHRLYESMGEVNDSDSGLKHAAHEAWNALARLDLMLREEEQTGD